MWKRCCKRSHCKLAEVAAAFSEERRPIRPLSRWIGADGVLLRIGCTSNDDGAAAEDGMENHSKDSIVRPKEPNWVVAAGTGPHSAGRGDAEDQVCNNNPSEEDQETVVHS